MKKYNIDFYDHFFYLIINKTDVAMVKNISLLSGGSFLEYYDFIIFAYLAPIITPLFFPTADPFSLQLKSLMIFALGYWARPLGSILFGHISDRFGRKKSFFYILLAMALATLFIGLLPTYNSIGIFATITLIILRITQGICFGAELPTAMTIASESNNKKVTFFMGSIVSSTALAACLASFTMWIFTSFFTQPQIEGFYFRIPFLIGSCLGFVCLVWRKKAIETKYFVNLDKNEISNFPLKTIIQEHYHSFIKGFFLTLFPASCIIVNLYFPTLFIKINPSLSINDIYFLQTLSFIWAIFFSPTVGYFLHKTSITKTFLILLIVFILFMSLLFPLLTQSLTLPTVLLFLILWQCFLCLGMILALQKTNALFPTAVRTTGVGLCYNFAFVTSACIPYLHTYLTLSFPSPIVLSTIFIFIAFSSCFVLLGKRITNKSFNKLS